MNLHRLLEAREAAGDPLRVALIGAGKFGSMFLAQARVTPGIRVGAIVDLSVDRARAALRTTGWPDDCTTTSLAATSERGHRIVVTDDTDRVLAGDGIDIVIDATGSASAGIRHVLACCASGKSIVMVNVEADALAGPLLARKAEQAGIVYSLAYGDQPALICEMVDCARTAGFDVVAAGKGTKYLPSYHASTPDTVWQH
jgi:predicted homoserine dehydrogenase-like protein